MAKEILVESRFDFRGGLNTSFSPDVLQTNELVQSTNTRLASKQGALEKRLGCRRMHSAAIGSGNVITGVFQWDRTGSAPQVVAICNGRLYHKTTEFGAFTQLIPSPAFSTTVRQYFAPMRSAVAGVSLDLYISDGVVYGFNSSALTRRDGVNSVPNADLMIPYHTRMFFRDVDLQNNLIWSVLGDPEDAATGTSVTAGGSALLGTLASDQIVAFEVIGSSLVICTGDSMIRFTGYASDDIRVEQDTEGISSEVGPVGPKAITRAENIGFIISDRGPFAFTEQSATPIGVKVESEFDSLDASISNRNNFVIGFHRGRREVWFAVAGASDSNLNSTVYIYSLRLNAWSGPFTYPFGITALGRYEDAAGDEFIMAGCDDGFVRHMDIGALDDVLSDGTGGSAFTMTVELAPIFFTSGPGYEKSLKRAHIQMEAASGAAVVFGYAVDNGAFTTSTLVEGGSGVQSYRVDMTGQGKRLRLRFTDASSVTPIVNGVIVEAYDMQRS